MSLFINDKKKTAKLQKIPVTLFFTGLWRSVHIDDLHRSTIMASDVTKLQNVTISQLFKPGDKPKCESQDSRLGTWCKRQVGHASSAVVLDATLLSQLWWSQGKAPTRVCPQRARLLYGSLAGPECPG